MNEALSSKWRDLRGLQVVSVAMGSVTLPPEDAEMIKTLQKSAVLRDTTMAAATLVGAQADAMRTAAGNSAGAMTGFMGMGMATAAGGANAQTLFAMQPQPAPAPAPAPAPVSADAWTCACGAVVKGKFCTECGQKRPEQRGWTCVCGAICTGKFCSECGAKKPAGAPLYRCDKCGFEPEDPKNPPKFCPECGDRFDEADIK